MKHPEDPFADLPRLGDEALGPCAWCHRPMLATETPLFYRITVEYCGIDRKVIDRRVGLGLMLGGGAAGIALAGVMGARERPVVVTTSGKTNLCMTCAQRHTELMVMAGAALEQACE